MGRLRVCTETRSLDSGNKQKQTYDVWIEQTLDFQERWKVLELSEMLLLIAQKGSVFLQHDKVSDCNKHCEQFYIIAPQSLSDKYATVCLGQIGQDLRVGLRPIGCEVSASIVLPA